MIHVLIIRPFFSASFVNKYMTNLSVKTLQMRDMQPALLPQKRPQASLGEVPGRRQAILRWRGGSLPRRNQS